MLPWSAVPQWMKEGGTCIFVVFVYSLFKVYCRFLSSRFHTKSRQLFSCYFSDIILQTDLLIFGVAAAVFGVACGMRWLPTYFDSPVITFCM